MAKEIILMIGYPGSGKTTIANSIEGYYRIDGDTFKTASAMKKEAEKYISTKNIIFDCTAGTKKKRGEFIEYAKKKNLPIRALWIKTPIDESMRRNEERGKNGGSKVPTVVFYVYRKHFEEPSLDEGFTEIQRVE